jgi:sec-independent protein translocase protein TatA
MPFGLGPTEVIIVLILALVVFGPKKLPEMARSVGKGIREFKSSVSMDDDDHHEHAATPPTGQAPTPAPSLPPAAPSQPASPAETTGSGTQR